MPNNSDVIIKNFVPAKSQNFPFLLADGRSWIEKLAHLLWTDYNIHDPGITILELLCYGITDLGYRTGYDVADLLTREVQGVQTGKGEFHTARSIFPVNPVSFNDLRKVLIDIEGIRNAWIERRRDVIYSIHEEQAKLVEEAPDPTSGEITEAPPLNGLYDVFIEFEDLNDQEKEDALAEVKQRLHRHRNLCQDFIEICPLKKEEIALCADVELAPEANVEETFAEILYRLSLHVSPPIRFYTIEELQQRGKTNDEIFEGPPLEHGFIDDDEFRAIERRCDLRSSDFIRIIMDVKGVTAVKNISLLSFIENEITGEYELRLQEPWVLPLAERGRAPVLTAERSKVVFYKNGLPYYPNRSRTAVMLKEKQATEIVGKLKGHKTDLPVPVGTDRSLSDYEPLQNELPITYRVGRIRVPETEGTERAAQARQLKAYLMFFEQIVADYLAQLSHVDELFSWQPGLNRTYFAQRVNGIADMADVYFDYDGLQNALDTIVEDEATSVERKNRLLNHLIARYCEDLRPYRVLLDSVLGSEAAERAIDDKRAFLENYPAISANRGKAFDYSLYPSNELTGYQVRVYHLLGFRDIRRRNLAGHLFSIEDEEVEGIRRWFFLLRDEDDNILFRSISCSSRGEIESLLDFALGLGGSQDNYRQRNTPRRYELVRTCRSGAEVKTEMLGETQQVEGITALQVWRTVINYFADHADAEGFHVVEHILLRQRVEGDPFMPIHLNAPGECDCVEVRDPYSFRMSVILPSWPKRFQDLRFRTFIEETLRTEAPAHIYPKICWVNHETMKQFEIRHNAWLKELANLDPNLGLCASETEQRRLGGALPLPGTYPERAGNYRDALADLIEQLHSMDNVYPLARLHDCESTDGDLPQITLNNTNLGTF